MAINSISDWFRRGWNRVNRSTVKNFFIPIGQRFLTNDITDEMAIEHGYRNNLTWYAITKKLAEATSNLPIILVDENKDGENITEGELFEKIFHPNKSQTLQELWEEQLLYYLNTGDCYFYDPVEAIGFESTEVIALPPQMIEPIMYDWTSILSDVKHYRLNDGKPKNILPEEMLHVMMVNPTRQGKLNKEGMSPLQAGWYKLQASNNSAMAHSQYFENRGVSNLISADGAASSKGLTMTPTQKEDLQLGIREAIGGAHKANALHVTTSPVQVHQLGASSSDMEMISSQVQLLRDLCNLIFMPSVLFNDPGNRTYSNYLEAKKIMYTDVAIPHGQKFVNAYTRKYVKKYNERNGTKLKLKIDVENIKSLKPDDMKFRELLLKEVDRGVITRGEYREMVGLDPLDFKEMDIPTVQNNINLIELLKNSNQNE